MNDYLALLLGVICAGAGGELFVRGAVGLAHWARISPGIIGATVVAFATSSPELSVSISAAAAGDPQIALGDALGANVLNIALILGVATTITAMHCPRDSLRRDFPAALLIPVITGVLFLDGELSRIDGALLLCLFCAWLAANIHAARRQRSAAETVLGEHRVGKATAYCGAGLAFLVIAGKLIVSSATAIAIAFGIDEFIIGATIVAIGTTVPELATTVIAKLRGHDEIGLGTVLGSTVFNGTFVVGIAALIHPISVVWREVAVALVFGAVALALTYPTRGNRIERTRGLMLLALYAAYLVAIFQNYPG